jgi:DNA-directed RNA polymerase specialized sigma24 family protein
MCLNVSRTYLKQASKYGTDTGEIGLDNQELLSRFPLPEQLTLANEFFSHILGDLDDSEIQQVILTRIIQGHSLSEIAAECRLSYSATAVRLHRLRRRLHSYLDAKNSAIVK